VRLHPESGTRTPPVGAGRAYPASRGKNPDEPRAATSSSASSTRTRSPSSPSSTTWRPPGPAAPLTLR